MEDIRAIYRIFNNLKYEMENNGWVYQWHLGDEPIKVTHKFNPPVTPEEFQLFEKYFPNMKLPASYKAFLSCSNGMELFCGEEGSSLVSCTIYSLKRALKEKIAQDPTAEHLLNIAQYFNPDEMSHINMFMAGIETISVTDAAIDSAINILKTEKKKILQRSFDSDETFAMRLKELQGGKE